MEKLPPQPEGNYEQNKKETEPETHANFRERSKQFLREISDAGPGNPFNTDDPRDAETVRMLTRVFRALEERTNAPINDEREEIDGYKFFTDAEERKHLFRVFRNAAEYIHKNEISDVVFIDRSARGGYIGIKEYYRNAFPDSPQPKVYFINPEGFQLDRFNESPASFRKPMFMSDDQKYAAIDKRFAEVYPHLMEDKNDGKKVMVFDACIHSGNAMKPVLDSFARLGFKDVKVGVYSLEAFTARDTINVDFEMTAGAYSSPCRPFQIDGILLKNADVVSATDRDDNSENFARVHQLRNEMLKIVRDGFDAKG